MIGIDALARRFAGLDRAELLRWVEYRWVLPERRKSRWVFHDVDVARVELILEIRREFAVEDETMSLVLGLLDQVYGLRRQIGRLADAIECQPNDIRDAIRKALPKAGDPR